MKNLITAVLIAISFFANAQYYYMVDGNKPEQKDTLFLTNGEVRPCVFVAKKKGNIIIRGLEKGILIKETEVARIALNIEFRKDIHFKALGDAGKFGIASVVVGVVGGTLAGIGGYKRIDGLTYTGIAVGAVSVPLGILSLGNLIRAGNHRF